MNISQKFALQPTGNGANLGNHENGDPVYNPATSGGMQSQRFASRSRRIMASVRIYKLYATGTSTASAVASLTIPRNGLIAGVSWASSIVAGAAASSGLTTELSTSSVSTITTNDTPGNSISTCSVMSSVSSSTAATNFSQSNLGIPVTAGDKLYFHNATLGTAPSAAVTICHIAVMH